MVDDALRAWQATADQGWQVTLGIAPCWARVGVDGGDRPRRTIPTTPSGDVTDVFGAPDAAAKFSARQVRPLSTAGEEVEVAVARIVHQVVAAGRGALRTPALLTGPVADRRRHSDPPWVLRRCLVLKGAAAVRGLGSQDRGVPADPVIARWTHLGVGHVRMVLVMHEPMDRLPILGPRRHEPHGVRV